MQLQDEPAAFTHSSWTVLTHDARGLPRFLRPGGTKGSHDPGAKTNALTGSSSLLRTKWPKYTICCKSIRLLTLIARARSKTTSLEILLTKLGGIRNIFRRHLAWNPSSFRCSALFRQTVCIPYASLLTTHASNTSICLRVEMLA